MGVEAGGVAALAVGVLAEPGDGDQPGVAVDAALAKSAGDLVAVDVVAEGEVAQDELEGVVARAS